MFFSRGAYVRCLCSGGLERHFSSLGFSYGTLRAQLGIEKAGKLALL